MVPAKKRINELIIISNRFLILAKPFEFSKLELEGLRYSVRLNLRIKLHELGDGS